MRLNAFRFVSVLLFAGYGYAANIAVIDSGVDYKHKTLVNNIWTNPSNQTVAKDGAKYPNDTHGWNFADKNNQIIDYKYLGTFSADCYKIFHVQSKILQGKATQEEKEWYAAKKKDENFLKELQKFGNFIHGTHVSGISTNKAEKSKVVALKLIPTETPGQIVKELVEKYGQSNDPAANPIVTLFLGLLAKQQAKMLVTTGNYTDAVKAEVANGSFGTSVAAVKPVLAPLIEQLTGQKPTDEELTEYAVSFVKQIADASKDFPKAASNTLFVFAAGNDGTDNDSLPCSPANIKLDNTITVAATLGTEALAVFSNYGASMVEVAAPGVAIMSTIPGDQELPLSGTSMAAPFVTNVAGLVKDANPSLTAVQIKKVLMETVDVKAFLQGKVKTGGIVNRARAVRAAEISRNESLDVAIAQANKTVPAIEESAFDTSRASDTLVVPLPSLF